MDSMTGGPGLEKSDVLFVGGYGRSGSSLLDAMMSAKAGAFSGGEMASLFEWALGGKPCTCGVMVDVCPLWAPILADLLVEMATSLTVLADLTRGGRPTSEGDRQLLAAAWAFVFRELHRRHGVTRVIDSSKTSGRGSREQVLLKVPNVRLVLFIHLYRRLAAVAFSRRRGNNYQLEAGVPGGSNLHMAKGVLGWVRANLNATRFCRSQREVCSIALAYEAFAADPELHVSRLIDLAGWKSPCPHAVTGSHAIAGNRMRRRPWDGAVSPDLAWTTELPRGWRIACHLIERAARRLRIVPSPESGGSTANWPYAEERLS